MRPPEQPLPHFDLKIHQALKLAYIASDHLKPDCQAAAL